MNTSSPWAVYEEWKQSARNLAGPSQHPVEGVFIQRTRHGFQVVNVSTAYRALMIQVTTDTGVSITATGPQVHEWYPRQGGGSISLAVGPDSHDEVTFTLETPPKVDPHIVLGTGLHAGIRSTAGWAVR